MKLSLCYSCQVSTVVTFLFLSLKKVWPGTFRKPKVAVVAGNGTVNFRSIKFWHFRDGLASIVFLLLRSWHVFFLIIYFLCLCNGLNILSHFLRTFNEWTRGMVLNTYPEVKHTELQRETQSCEKSLRVLRRTLTYENSHASPKPTGWGKTPLWLFVRISTTGGNLKNLWQLIFRSSV